MRITREWFKSHHLPWKMMEIAIWLCIVGLKGKKVALLADFVIGTVDQIFNGRASAETCDVEASGIGGESGHYRRGTFIRFVHDDIFGADFKLVGSVPCTSDRFVSYITSKI